MEFALLPEHVLPIPIHAFFVGEIAVALAPESQLSHESFVWISHMMDVSNVLEGLLMVFPITPHEVGYYCSR